jgi:putative transposase
MSQIGRNFTDANDSILNGKRYLTRDRDPPFIAEFLELVASVGVQSVKLPPLAPNLMPTLSGSCGRSKESCLERMILFGEKALRTAISQFVRHYLQERNHQGLANRIIDPGAGLFRAAP